MRPIRGWPRRSGSWPLLSPASLRRWPPLSRLTGWAPATIAWLSVGRCRRRPLAARALLAAATRQRDRRSRCSPAPSRSWPLSSLAVIRRVGDSSWWLLVSGRLAALLLWAAVRRFGRGARRPSTGSNRRCFLALDTRPAVGSRRASRVLRHQPPHRQQHRTCPTGWLGATPPSRPARVRSRLRRPSKHRHACRACSSPAPSISARRSCRRRGALRWRRLRQHGRPVGVGLPQPHAGTRPSCRGRRRAARAAQAAAATHLVVVNASRGMAGTSEMAIIPGLGGELAAHSAPRTSSMTCPPRPVDGS